MKISVITERCIGAGNCVETALEYFDQDPADGVVILLNAAVAPTDEEKARLAADLCPVGAIELST